MAKPIDVRHLPCALGAGEQPGPLERSKDLSHGPRIHIQASRQLGLRQVEGSAVASPGRARHVVDDACPGVAEEEVLVRKGIAAHSTSYKRWSLPQQYVTLTGMWVPCTGVLCDDLPGMLTALDVPAGALHRIPDGSLR